MLWAAFLKAPGCRRLSARACDLQKFIIKFNPKPLNSYSFRSWRFLLLHRTFSIKKHVIDTIKITRAARAVQHSLAPGCLQDVGSPPHSHNLFHGSLESFAQSTAVAGSGGEAARRAWLQVPNVPCMMFKVPSNPTTLRF